MDMNMDRLENLLNICYSYKFGVYDIREFQSRIDTALLPEPETELAHKFKKLVDIEGIRANIELAIYAYGEERALEVADELIDAVHKIQKQYRDGI